VLDLIRTTEIGRLVVILFSCYGIGFDAQTPGCHAIVPATLLKTGPET